MGRASREKGKRGEREFAQILRDLGFQAERTVQYCGRNGTSDVSSSLDGVHIEVKRYARIAALRFMEQAVRDCPSSDLPVVAMREDHGEWMIMIRVKDLPGLATKFVEGRET